MKKSFIAVATTTAALAAVSVFVPSAAFAVGSTVSFSPSTICPGETSTLTINGQTSGTQVVPSGASAEYWEMFADGSPSPAYVATPGQNFNLLADNPLPYTWFTGYGATTSLQFQVQNGTAPGILNEATITLLAACTAPAPSPLPDTGLSGSGFASLAGFAALAGLAGSALLFARNRRARASE